MNLRDRGVLITGASRGIGAAMARSFGRRGSRLVLVGRSQDELVAVCREVEDAGAVCGWIRADLSREDEREHAVEQALAILGTLDVLVNNAGSGLYGRVEDLSSEQLRTTLELNVVAPAHLCSLALGPMRERQSGVVVMVSSVLGGRAIPLSGGYCASKFALEGLSQSLRAELGDSGVSVLMVRPGRTETSFRSAAISAGHRPTDTLRAMSAEDVAEATSRAIELGRSSVNLTAAGRAMLFGERVAPRLVDRMMIRLYRRMTSS